MSRLHGESARGKNCLSNIRKLQDSDICIPKDSRPYFESWRDPTRFFYPSHPREARDPIRARIYAFALHGLRLRIDPKSLQLRPEVRKRLEQVVHDSSLVEDALIKDISRWTSDFLKFGERMNTVAKSNGGVGALIMIPTSVLTQYQWTNRLNTPDFGLAVKHLQSIGVNEEANRANAHVTVKQILDLFSQKYPPDLSQDPDADQEEAMAEEDGNEPSTDDEEMGEANNNPNVEVQERGNPCIHPDVFGIHTEPTRSLNIELGSLSQSYRYEQTQRSPASRLPSVHHLIHATPPHHFGTDSTGEMTMDSSVHQSFSSFELWSFPQSNPRQRAHGSFSGRCLQYDGSHMAPSRARLISGPVNFVGEASGLRFADGITADPIDYFPTFPEPSSVFAGEVSGFPPDTGYTPYATNYFPTWPESSRISAGDFSGFPPDTGYTPRAISYFPTWPESSSTFASEAHSLDSNTALTTGAVDYFLTYPESDSAFASDTCNLHPHTRFTTGTF